MRQIKSERLKKLEAELGDLEQWLKLGLVPKKDIEKHKQEILSIKERVEEELQRISFLKESGEVEEYTAPKRGAGRSTYTEMPTLPDIDVTETGAAVTDHSFDMATDTAEEETDDGEEETDTDTTEEVTKEKETDEDSFFNDRNRWGRGGILDPDADEW